MNSATNACHDDKRRGGIHSRFCKWGISASYLECLRVVAVAKNLSLYYVRSKKCMVRERWGENEGLSISDLPYTQRILGRSQARHLHLCNKQKHGRSHEGSMFWGLFS